VWLGASLTGRHSVGGRRLRLFRWLPAIDRKSGIPTLGPPPSETAPQRRPIAIRLSYPVDSPGGRARMVCQVSILFVGGCIIYLNLLCLGVEHGSKRA